MENKKNVNGLVSCVIPTYKRCDSLIRAIDSILNQTYPNVEVVLVNDNNPDDEYTQQVEKKLEKYSGDARIRFIKQEHHTNGAIARNVGIKASSGEFVGFLDDDDEWEEDKAMVQVDFLNNNPEYGGCACLARSFQSGELFSADPPYKSGNIQFDVLRRYPVVGTPSLLARRDVLLKSPMFNPNLKRHQDSQFYIELLEITQIKIINRHLVRIHRDDTTNRPNLEKIIECKKALFQTIYPIYKKYNWWERRRIVCGHAFEVLRNAWKSRNIKYVFISLLRINFFIPAYIDVIKKYLFRKNKISIR